MVDRVIIMVLDGFGVGEAQMQTSMEMKEAIHLLEYTILRL